MTTFRKNKTLLRIACLFVTISFLSNAVLPGYARAQELFLPLPQQFVPLSNSYSFPVLKGLKFDPATPFNMQFIIDTADQKDIDKDEANRLIKYFFAGLAIPEQDTWVNMSSYEKDRIIPLSLSETDLGKDLLSLDYILKQVSVSLTYPDSEIGKDFWSKTYAAVLNIAHTTNLPINTFNKIWIMPDKAEVYENGNFALVHEATLKTMLEEDYLALKNNISDIQKQKKNMKEELIEKINKASSNVMREFILPKINKDVNSGKNFATLRQIYYALVLGVWFKKKFKDSIYKYYINQGKVKGIDINDKDAKDKIYNLYIEGLKKGLYNYVKSDYDPGTKRNIKRQYFSGGFTAMNLASSAIVTPASEIAMQRDFPAPGSGRLASLVSSPIILGSSPIGAGKSDIAGSRPSPQNKGSGEGVPPRAEGPERKALGTEASAAEGPGPAESASPITKEEIDNIGFILNKGFGVIKQLTGTTTIETYSFALREKGKGDISLEKVEKEPYDAKNLVTGEKYAQIRPIEYIISFDKDTDLEGLLKFISNSSEIRELLGKEDLENALERLKRPEFPVVKLEVELAEWVAKDLHKLWQGVFRVGQGPEGSNWQAVNDSEWEAVIKGKVQLEIGKPVGNVRLTKEPKKDKDGNTIKDKDGNPETVTVMEFDIAHTDFKDLALPAKVAYRSQAQKVINQLKEALKQGIDLANASTALENLLKELESERRLDKESFEEDAVKAFILVSAKDIHKTWTQILKSHGQEIPEELKVKFEELSPQNQKTALSILKLTLQEYADISAGSPIKTINEYREKAIVFLNSLLPWKGKNGEGKAIIHRIKVSGGLELSRKEIFVLQSNYSYDEQGNATLIHFFSVRDDINPVELLQIVAQQLAKYLDKKTAESIKTQRKILMTSITQANYGEIAGLQSQTAGSPLQKIETRNFLEMEAPFEFGSVATGYLSQKVNAGLSMAEAVRIVAEAARKYDPERGGAMALEDREAEAAQGENIPVPELVAAVFGRKVQQDINTINDFMRRHLGDSAQESDALGMLGFIQAEGTGIGGQRNVSGMLKDLVRLYRNRKIYLHSAYGVPFRQIRNEFLQRLRAAHADLETAQSRWELLKQRKEKVKAFRRAASKSGTTPETMFGFQWQITEDIRMYAMFIYGDSDGEKFAELMIAKLYDGENLLTGGKSIDKLNPGERMMLAIVLDRVIMATGDFKKEQVKEGGRARVGGSMFDFFAKTMAEKLQTEFKELGIKGISKVSVYDRFGGRTNVLGPDAFINIAFALYDGKTDVLNRLIETARPIAQQHNNMADLNLWGKRLAAYTMSRRIESLYIGLPSGIQTNVIDAFQELIGESIDVGALVGHPVGIKAIVHQTTALAAKSEYRKDAQGSRLYLLVTDELADNATKEAEEKIIRQQIALGNHVVRIKIKDHSPAEVTKLYYEMMNFVEWYGNFTAIELLSQLHEDEGIIDHLLAPQNGYGLERDDIKPIKFDNADSLSKTMAILFSRSELGNDQESKYLQALRKVVLNINPWFQPGVEKGKAIAETLCKKLFVDHIKTVIDPATQAEIEVPIRSEDKRQARYRQDKALLEKSKGAYIVNGAVHHSNKQGEYVSEVIDTQKMPALPVSGKANFEEIQQSISQIIALRQKQQSLYDTINKQGEYELKTRRARLDALEKEIEARTQHLLDIAGQVEGVINEETAKEMAMAAFQAHQKGQSTNISFYAGRQKFEYYGLGSFINRALAMIDLFQYAPDKQHTDADGDINGTKRTFQFLTLVREPHEGRIVVDGMVPAYANGMTDQDFIAANHQAYAEVYQKRGIDFIDLRLEAETEEDIAKIFILFARADRYCSVLNEAAVASSALAKRTRPKSIAQREKEFKQGPDLLQIQKEAFYNSYYGDTREKRQSKLEGLKKELKKMNAVMDVKFRSGQNIPTFDDEIYKLAKDLSDEEVRRRHSILEDDISFLEKLLVSSSPIKLTPKKFNTIMDSAEKLLNARIKEAEGWGPDDHRTITNEVRLAALGLLKEFRESGLFVLEVLGKDATFESILNLLSHCKANAAAGSKLEKEAENSTPYQVLISLLKEAEKAKASSAITQEEKGNYLKIAKNEVENYLKKQFADKKISEEIFNKAMDVTYNNLKFWATDESIRRLSPETQDAIFEAIQQNRWKDIVEVFRQDITFGTAGIRGRAALTLDELLLLKNDGPLAKILKGPNTINDIVLLRYTTGVIRYAKEKGLHKVVIGYDSRIAGEQFAEMITQCFIAQSTPEYKFTVYLFDEASPFPELSFGLTTKAVRADLGILISASHNPSEYNGYKVTDSTGSQLPQRMKDEVKAAISKVATADIKLKALEEAERGQLIWLGGKEPIRGKDYKGVDVSKPENFIDMHTLHVEQVKKFILDKDVVGKQAKNLSIGFSAFNGSGNKAVPRLLNELGFTNVKVIEKLQELDGLFPAFGWGEQPDPGDPISADIAVKEFIAEHGQTAFDKLDILIGTDPDADRMGLIVKVPESQQQIFGKYRLLSANDVWTLLIWYRLMKKQELGLLSDPKKHYITFSHVTTDALEQAAALFGVPSLGEMYDKAGAEERGYHLNGRRTWVGFTYIADFGQKMRVNGFINEGGAEESNGFSILGGPIKEGEVIADDAHVNDKDGTFAGILLAEIASYAKEKNTTIFELLDNIYLRIGHYATANKPLPRVGSFEGAEGITEKINLLKKAQEWMQQANARAKSENPFVLGGLKVIGAVEFKSGRYDEQHYKGFPDEGVRFFFKDSILKDSEPFYSSKNYITIRPSGTSQTIRFYTQIYSTVSKEKIAEQKFANYLLAEKLALQAQKELLAGAGITKYIPKVDEQLEKLNKNASSPTTNAESEIDPSLRGLRMRNDNSEAGTGTPYGGIDLGNIDVAASPNSIPVNMPPIDPATFQGFTFRIIKIEPIINLSSIFGPSEKLAEEPKPQEQLAYLKE